MNIYKTMFTLFEIFDIISVMVFDEYIH